MIADPVQPLALLASRVCGAVIASYRFRGDCRAGDYDAVRNFVLSLPFCTYFPGLT